MSHGSQAGIKTMDDEFVPISDMLAFFKGDRLPTMAGTHI